MSARSTLQRHAIPLCRKSSLLTSNSVPVRSSSSARPLLATTKVRPERTQTTATPSTTTVASKPAFKFPEFPSIAAQADDPRFRFNESAGWMKAHLDLMEAKRKEYEEKIAALERESGVEDRKTDLSSGK